MTHSFKHYNLPLRHPFTLGNGTSRTHTPVTILTLEYKGVRAYGEAAMPPYLGETPQSTEEFYSLVPWKELTSPFNSKSNKEFIEQLKPGHTAAKASVNTALWFLEASLQGCSITELAGLAEDQKVTTFTIGIDKEDIVAQKVREGIREGFLQFKAKLGSADDLAIIKAIRSETQLPLFADVNQGWNDRSQALELCHALKEFNVSFIEQPLEKSRFNDLEWLSAHSPLPIFADESCQRLIDVEIMKNCVHGINVKLMKCTGINEAIEMATLAKEYKMQTMIGCMTETSCATYAALSISSLFDYLDLDGPWILAQQPFREPEIAAGKIIPGFPLPGLNF